MQQDLSMLQRKLSKTAGFFRSLTDTQKKGSLTGCFIILFLSFYFRYALVKGIADTAGKCCFLFFHNLRLFPKRNIYNSREFGKAMDAAEKTAKKLWDIDKGRCPGLFPGQ